MHDLFVSILWNSGPVPRAGLGCGHFAPEHLYFCQSSNFLHLPPVFEQRSCLFSLGVVNWFSWVNHLHLRLCHLDLIVAREIIHNRGHLMMRISTSPNPLEFCVTNRDFFFFSNHQKNWFGYFNPSSQTQWPIRDVLHSNSWTLCFSLVFVHGTETAFHPYLTSLFCYINHVACCITHYWSHETCDQFRIGCQVIL